MYLWKILSFFTIPGGKMLIQNLTYGGAKNFFEDIETLLSERRILLLTGLRRVGKTSLMKLSIQHLLEKGIKPKNIFYISMDDYVFKNSTIHEIVALYRKIQKVKTDEKVYLFFDEVAYKK
jgi:predicted AAA+ superfamily ATPase